MAVEDAYVFPGFLTPVLTLLFFPKPPTTFLTCFCRVERRKYAKILALKQFLFLKVENIVEKGGKFIYQQFTFFSCIFFLKGI